MDWSVSCFLMMVVVVFIFFSSPSSHKDRNSNFIYISVNKKSTSSTEMHKYKPFYYASNNCTCNSLKSCCNAWTSPERAFITVISNTDLRSGVYSLGPAEGTCVCRTLDSIGPQVEGGWGQREWEQLINTGINLNTFSESWKVFASKILLDHCWLYIVRRLSGITMFMPSSLNQKEKETS